MEESMGLTLFCSSSLVASRWIAVSERQEGCRLGIHYENYQGKPRETCTQLGDFKYLPVLLSIPIKQYDKYILRLYPSCSKSTPTYYPKSTQ